MSVSNPITIQIAEDQEITRFGLKCALESFPNLKVIAESADGETAVLDALTCKPQVILMDIGLPKMDGIEASKKIKEAQTGIRIIMFTTFDNDDAIYRALSAGADGYCFKNVAPQHLYSAIEAVNRGVTWLDPGIAERVLRSRLLQLDKVAPPPIEPVKSGKKGSLTENHLQILQLLSEGSDLNYVAKQFDLSPEKVAERIKAIISSVQARPYGNSEPTLNLLLEEPKPMMIGDRYSIESVLGQGGMGIVYKGRHLLMDRPVAIKMLHPEHAADENIAKRFLSEAKSLSAVSHGNLVTVFDFGMTAAKEPYMVMEYHEGRALDDLMHEATPIGLQAAINLFSQVCDALTGVHERNIVHRDIKPGNILISESGQVKLVDFGIAKSFDGKSKDLTMSGEVVGTPSYMSPEQCMGQALDATSDIYSLGCVMFEFFTGRPPFDSGNFLGIVHKHIHEVPSRVPFYRLLQHVPSALEEAIFQTLEKEPGKRQQSAALLKRDLAAVSATGNAVH